MKIVTERLILRNIKITDVNDITEGISNYKVSKWLLKAPHPYTHKDALKWAQRKKIKKDDFTFVIELKEEKKVIGAIGLHRIDKSQGTAGTGYWLNEKYHKKGYGSEALGAILNLAFNKYKLRRINANVFTGNPASGKLLEKFGAKKEGLARKAAICKADGKIKDEIRYGLLKEDYIKALKKR